MITTFVYLLGCVASYYSIREVFIKQFGRDEYGWGQITFQLFTALFSWISFIVGVIFMIPYIDFGSKNDPNPKNKPPKWL